MHPGSAWLQLLNLAMRIGTEKRDAGGERLAEALNPVVTIELAPEDEISEVFDFNRNDFDRYHGRVETAPDAISTSFDEVDGKLFGSFVLRAADVYDQWPFDALALIRTQRDTAARTGLEIGSATFVIHAARLYERDWDRSLRVLDRYFKRPLPLQVDPSGIFLYGKQKTGHRKQEMPNVGSPAFRCLCQVASRGVLHAPMSSKRLSSDLDCCADETTRWTKQCRLRTARRLWPLAVLAVIASGCLYGRPPVAIIQVDGTGSITGKITVNQCLLTPQNSSRTFVSCAVSLHGILGGLAIQYFLGSSYFVVHHKNEVHVFDNPFDPAVLQFPDTVSNFAGTFTNGTTGNLVIRSGIDCLPISRDRQLCAEPGNQLVVVDLPPDTTPGVEYEFSLTFTVQPVAPIDVKAMSTLKATVGNSDYYLPIVPCADSLAGITPFTIPVGTAVEVLPTLDGVGNCIDRTLDLTGNSAHAPLLGGRFLVALIMGLAALGGLMVSKHRQRS